MKNLKFILALVLLSFALPALSQTTNHQRVKIRKTPAANPTDTIIAVRPNGLVVQTDIQVQDLLNAGGGDPGLVPLDEGNGEGFRLKGIDPANSANVGLGAIDLSVNQAANTTFGATGASAIAHGTDVTAGGSISTVLSSFQGTATGYGNVILGCVFNTNVTSPQGGGAYSASRAQNAGTYSAIVGGDENVIEAPANKSFIGGGDNNRSYNIRQFLWGRVNRARSENEAAGGMYNVDEPADNTLTARLLSIGNGVNGTTRSDAFTVRRNGEVAAPSATTATIEGNPKSLVTYEYFTANSGGSLPDGFYSTGTQVAGDIVATVGDNTDTGTRLLVDMSNEVVELTGSNGAVLKSQAVTEVSSEFDNILLKTTNAIQIRTGGLTEAVTLDADNLTANRSVSFQDASGTIALLSDIPAGGSANTQSVSLTLTPAQIQSLRNVPQTIIPAPGAGKFINVIDATYFLDFGTTVFDYGSSNDFLIECVGNTQPIYNLTSSNLNQAQDRIKKLDHNTSASYYALTENTAVQLRNENDDPTQGDSSITIYLTYQVLDL